MKLYEKIINRKQYCKPANKLLLYDIIRIGNYDAPLTGSAA